MPMYRCYGLGRTGTVKAGEWVEADDDESARCAVVLLIDAHTPQVEIWDGVRRVGVVAATPPDACAKEARARRPRRGRAPCDVRLAI